MIEITGIGTIKDTDDCILWTKGLYGNGYGQGPRGYYSRRVHLIVYSQVFGSIPDGYIVHHKCKNKACYNPKHLELVHKSVHKLLHCKLSPAAVAIIRYRYNNNLATDDELAAEYGISPNHVRSIGCGCRRKEL